MGYKPVPNQPTNGFPQNNYYNENNSNGFNNNSYNNNGFQGGSSHPAYGGKGANMYGGSFNVELPHTAYGNKGGQQIVTGSGG